MRRLSGEKYITWRRGRLLFFGKVASPDIRSGRNVAAPKDGRGLERSCVASVIPDSERELEDREQYERKRERNAQKNCGFLSRKFFPLRHLEDGVDEWRERRSLSSVAILEPGGC